MLAVDVRQSLKDGETVEQGASRWWRFSTETVAEHGDYLLAFVDGEVCIGAFSIEHARVDDEVGKYVFDLAPAPRFQWLLGKKLPINAGRNPARIVTGQALRELVDSSPQ